MKVVLLAGGYGTRISEETHLKPKPMIEIGDKPILWHIMNIFSKHGFREFVICLGYKGHVIKEYFAHYYLHGTDVTFDFGNHNQRIVHDRYLEPWKVTLVETGRDTMTGGRLKRVQKYVGQEPFLMTYGDGLADIDIGALVEFHKSHGKLATVTAVQPLGRFGALQLEDTLSVKGFMEKPRGDGGWMNGGFFVLEPQVLNYIDEDSEVWEQRPLRQLAEEGQLMAYKHSGFWQPMDTLRDKNYLEELWASGRASWK
ncbi:glucose-1-phosphate cytidylyltransferase [Paenibacillus sp. GCM10012307]|uniref:Glucose-1-phosphate cytidylyltransferase n=1 Tax=Paenibacillus roseus TaxID=2798579 RepID=A0A934J952_9BACL|nr:glucose-1-phosphate cytidylyltransferase [Paenibacillus roseus]MBJ6362722.1 glucose-1-phosphate cytidylyltransferase [Paenibacillus roseus]